MKLNPREAEGYFARPDPKRAGLLIHGGDAMRVALKRQQVIAALLGDGAEEEMRLTRISGTDLRKEPALLLDAIKAVGFFPGLRAVLVDEAGDANAPAIIAALADWREGDACIFATATALKPASKLRKAFEGHSSALAAGIYDDPPSRAEIARQLSSAGLRDIPDDAMAMLTALALHLSPGDFAQTLEKIALYKSGDPAPLGPDEIDACAPQSTEAALDDVLDTVAEGRSGDIGPLLRRVQAQGTNAVALCIAATRHFRTLLAVASDPGGAVAGAGRMRPPLFGKRRDRIVRQATIWSPHNLQSALSLLTDTDLTLRSAGRTAPAMALVERTLIRLAMLAQRR